MGAAFPLERSVIYVIFVPPFLCLSHPGELPRRREYATGLDDGIAKPTWDSGLWVPSGMQDKSPQLVVEGCL